MKIKSLIKHNLMRAAMTLALILACAAAWADNVSTYYIDENGTRHDVNATVLAGTGTLTADQWYVVNDNVTFSSGRIYSTGNIKLILADGMTFTISSNDTEGIISTIYGTVSIYGQENGTGTLNVTANGSSGNAIYGSSGVNIVGGHITATSTGGAGIQSGGNITISGGQVSATGGSGKYGLRTFYTITLGWRNPTDYVYANSYFGTVNVKDGQAFKDDSGNIYVGTLNNSQINGKTLTPATQTEYIQYCLGTGNDGSDEYPYTISDANGWNAFCLALDDKDTWNGFSGKTVKLGANIAVSRMAGSDHLDFAGTFDGNRKTLTFNYTTTESIDRVAPFSYITNNTPEGSTTPSPAVIRNLDVVVNITTGGQYAGGIVGEAWGQLTIEHCTVSGTITTSNKYAGGIIGHVSNTPLNITDCRSSVTIISSVDGDGTHGGIAASMANSSSIALNISGCVFDGKLLTTNGTTDCGGFVGWRSRGSSLNISNSLYAPATIADDEIEVLPDDDGNNPSATFARNWTMPANSNNYYTRTLGTLQGKQRLSITAGNYVTVANAGAATVYATSGITTYGTGIKYDDVLYAGDGDAVSLTLTNTPPEGYVFNGYTVSPEGTTLTGSGNAYTLTMPNEDVTIVADLFYCPAPTLTLEDNSITAYGATVSWTGSSESYILEYAEGNSPSTWITVSSNAVSPYTFSDLTPATTYSVRVTGNCDDVNSQPSDVVSFTTDCGDFIVVDAAHPFTEGFEGEDFPPRCWESIATDDHAWSRVFYDENRFCAYSDYFGSIYLVMPDIQLPSQGTAQLTFWSLYTYLSTYSNQGKSSVVLRSGGTETELWVLNITGLENYNWYETTIDLTAFMGQTISLAFKYEGNNAHGWYVDDVEVTATASIFTKDIEGYEDDESGWYLIASPLAGSIAPTEVHNLFPSAGETSNDYDLYRFNQSADLEWQNYHSHTDDFNLVNGQGYLYANSEDVTLTFTGTPYNGSGQVTLSKDDNARLGQWNLIGNPFAQTAYVDGRPFYVMNLDGSEIIASDRNDFHVEPMEGIFVKAEQDGETMTFIPNTRSKGHIQKPEPEQIVINLSTLNPKRSTSIIDRAIVRFDESRQLPKFQIRENSTKIYIPQDGKDYAIVSVGNMGEIPLNFKANENGTYTISVDVDNVEMAYLHLIDNMTGADVDLLAANDGDARHGDARHGDARHGDARHGDARHGDAINRVSTYTFEAKTTDYASRFRLVFFRRCPR